ncbi:MAG: hypothetical protein K2F65_04910, partial [Eubacterium sp.]|nr:hypothetical protein [Eubacterium sp.]
VFEYMADYEKQGIALVDYEYDDAYLNFFTYGRRSQWEISFNVTFSNGAQGYVTISRDNDKYCLISSDVDKTESFKNQRFFNQLWFAVWGRYYVEESYERF